jgi:hypothetical protein
MRNSVSQITSPSLRLGALVVQPPADKWQDVKTLKQKNSMFCQISGRAGDLGFQAARLGTREKVEGSELATDCSQLKMLSMLDLGMFPRSQNRAGHFVLQKMQWQE